VGAESPRLAKQLIDQRGLAVVDMGDDGDVANVHGDPDVMNTTNVGALPCHAPFGKATLTLCAAHT